MAKYPVSLELSGKAVLVVGGGEIALRRTRSALNAGAIVTVIAPVIDERFSKLTVTTHDREFEADDLDGAWLVHACTSATEVNAAVAAECRSRRIWCLRADDAEASDAWLPAVATSGEVSVAITSGDPLRSRAIRDEVLRLLDSGAFPTRAQRSSTGRVSLVGGGPGDPGLITVRGRVLLLSADVVVVDRLAPRELLDFVSDGVELIDAGKSSHAHNMTQDQINAVIVERALAGKHVVRLKGGDPFVFGRGGEEALACVAAGVPFEVIPGVTSAISVPGLAGIPVTHRGITQDFSVISAHLDPAASGSTVDWSSLAKTQGTLVMLMAVERLAAITDALIAGGRSGETPTAVISNGSTPDERVEIGTLAGIAAQCLAAGIAPPAVVVVGEVVSLRAKLGL